VSRAEVGRAEADVPVIVLVPDDRGFHGEHHDVITIVQVGEHLW
jgi:hypothetical protein